jgi:DegV family protein with EDD domain
MGGIRVVTDTTCSLFPSELEDAGVLAVPLEVIVDGTSLAERVDVNSGDVAAALHRGAAVSTSRPAPSAFLAVYEQARDEGADAVVSVHISSAISGTLGSAQIAASEAPLPVSVVDSRQVSMGLGYAVLSAAAAAADGADASEVAEVARHRAASALVTFYVDTLEYLRRGGRISTASAVVGSALSVKPLLHMVDGSIEMLEKVRTTSRAIRTLEDRAVRQAKDGSCDVAVQHLATPARAEKLAEHLRERLDRPVSVREVGAVLGAHVGPGLLATAIAPVDAG